jgi:magnesium transporter
VDGHLIAKDGSTVDCDRETAERLLAKDELLWLDIQGLDSDGSAMLREVFGIHPLALEDAEHFGQRPKMEAYDDFTHLVAYGAQSVGEPMVEVHCFYSERYLVTVRLAHCTAFKDLRGRFARHTGKPLSRLIVLHHLVDSLVDSFFPVLSGFDDSIDALQDKIFAKPTDEQLSELFGLKRWLIGVRKVVTPQRDLFASLIEGVTELPGMTPEVERYFRDLYDHLIRISDLVDSYRDLLSSSMDAYLSIVSNRLNSVMKQLTIIATIFLPLSFLTGFFGQNFSWLVAHLTGAGVFIGAGLGTEVLAVGGLLVLFRRRGWM